MNDYDIYCINGEVIHIEAEDFERNLESRCVRFYYTTNDKDLGQVQRNVAIFELRNICGIRIYLGP